MKMRDERKRTEQMGRDRPYIKCEVSVNKSYNFPIGVEGDAEQGQGHHVKIRRYDRQTPDKAVLAAQSAMRYHRQP